MTGRRAGVVRDLRRTGVMAILDGGLVRPPRMPAIASRLFRAGIRVFQIRMKASGDGEVLRVVRAIRRAIPAARLVVNDRCDLAVAVNADGVHLGQDDLPVADARRIIGNHRFVGLSAGTRGEVRRAIAARPDAISLGPFFGTRTKGDAGRPLGERRFRMLGSLIPRSVPVLAIGGITPDNGAVPLICGAHAVAVASGLTGARVPDRAARRLLGTVRRARRDKTRSTEGTEWRSSTRS